jgi:hypothetical protein
LGFFATGSQATSWPFEAAAAAIRAAISVGKAAAAKSVPVFQKPGRYLKFSISA